MLIGDIIVQAREAFPDIAGIQTFPAPTLVSATVAAGTFLPSGTWYAVVTLLNPWGETLASNELTFTTTPGNQNVTIVISFPGLLSNISGAKVYFGTTSGQENQYQQFPAGSTFILNASTGVATPPTINTARMPDTDGLAVGASTVYRWINEAINKLSSVVGGILDYSGIPTVAGQGMYVANGTWKVITDVWYNGYWVQGGDRSNFFKRNAVTSQILNAVTVSIYDDRVILEVDYQTDRTAGTTTTTANMASADTSVPITNTGFTETSFGFALIGTEIVAYYTLAGGVMGGLIRRIGGTTAQAWPSGTVVTELPLVFSGRRIFTTQYQPGQAMTVIPVPDVWQAFLVQYLIAKFRDAEGDLQSWEAKIKSFIADAKDQIPSNQQRMARVQVGGFGGGNGPVTFANTPAGGLIIP